MFERLEKRYANASLLHRLLMVWIASGALVHGAIPALHSAMTPVGPVALWLWFLPLMALALDLVAAPSPRPTALVIAATNCTRRRRAAAIAPRIAISRRDRPRSAVVASPVARRVRRAG